MHDVSKTWHLETMKGLCDGVLKMGVVVLGLDKVIKVQSINHWGCHEEVHFKKCIQK